MGLRDVVISPGSRNAPLIMAFVRFGKFNCISSLDERSAAFVALGVAKRKRQPCAVICTSGSALANFYPAVLEAHYMQVPLLLISADRPAFMIDRWDGQTIHQTAFFQPHIKAEFQMPEFDGHISQDLVSDVCKDLWKAAMEGVKGPAHLNVPMAEPLYGAVDQDFDYPQPEQGTYKPIPHKDEPVPNDIIQALSASEKVMVLMGEGSGSEAIAVNPSFNRPNTLVLCDLLSLNRQHATVANWESALMHLPDDKAADYMPEILVSTGKMVLNKKLKQLLRTYKPKLHIHLEPNGYCADTFLTDPQVIRTRPEVFFSLLDNPGLNSGYSHSWKLLCQQRQEAENDFDFETWSELGAMHYLATQLKDCTLHLANSMTIRNMAYLSQYLDRSVEVFGNRGVSGIDGCTSTALGMALATPDKSHVLITGDLAFIYDSNAFLSHLLPQNLKIIVSNNNGGGIFRMIDGPSGMRELDPFMTTPHGKDIGKLAEFHQLKHGKAVNFPELRKAFEALMHSGCLSILEIETDQIKNTQIFNQFKSINIC